MVDLLEPTLLLLLLRTQDVFLCSCKNSLFLFAHAAFIFLTFYLCKAFLTDPWPLVGEQIL